jgi:hypothetical protein
MIIGITGRKRNGKDTIGNYLCEHHEFKRFAYADALKEACKSIFNFTDEQLYGDLKEVVDPFWGATPRTVLQFVGTDLFRNNMGKIIPNLEYNIWVKVVEKKISEEHRLYPHQNIVITDVRFPNEVESIKNLGGRVIRVSRPELNISNGIDVHASEIQIEYLKVDKDLINDGTKDMLYLQLEQYIKSELERLRDHLAEIIKNHENQNPTDI